jgi:hypothetical protein
MDAIIKKGFEFDLRALFIVLGTNEVDNDLV